MLRTNLEMIDGSQMLRAHKRERIRIAFIQPAYARYRQPLFERFQDHYDVDFYFLRKSPVHLRSENSKELLSVYELGKTAPSSSDSLFFPLKRYLILFLFLIRNNYAAIITSDCRSPQTMISLLLSKIARSRHIVWVEEWFVPRPTSLTSMIRFSLSNLIVKCVLENADAIVVEGTPQRRYVKNFGASLEKVFRANHCSLDYSEFKSANLKKKLNIRKGLVVLYVGRIVERKGLDVLIRAFSKIEHEREDVYLVICGDGKSRDSCEYLAEEMKTNHIIFTGMAVREEEKASFYRTADVFVLPSCIVASRRIADEVSEGWGLVINEAMSMGKPIITTDAVGAARDLVRNGVNGYIVKNGETDALFLALRRIIDEPKLRKTMGANSRKIFEEFNDFKKMFEGFKKAIEYCVT
jgi:glycosyltransferase involved in cell wall biosynthesis